MLSVKFTLDGMPPHTLQCKQELVSLKAQLVEKYLTRLGIFVLILLPDRN